ncbi:hypothetical protein CEXT_247921 [Caerostris extrusa]|uniref:Uncharacterized protein n=1 Tax=Caerostris extrusa TaxID=172846 RepID=A0AAV4N909_CAEEX|nr:hypothetical protein CEXT_247921 [Caerostris extrusa]
MVETHEPAFFMAKIALQTALLHHLLVHTIIGPSGVRYMIYHRGRLYWFMFDKLLRNEIIRSLWTATVWNIGRAEDID